MDNVVGMVIGGIVIFGVGATCGALYATDLYGKKPADLVEAQKERNNKWGNEIKIALGFNKEDQQVQEVEQAPQQQEAQPVVVEEVTA